MNTGDAFVAKLDTNGALVYSSFFGGSLDDMAVAIAIDSASNIYIGGLTLSSNLTTSSPIQSTFGGSGQLIPADDAFFEIRFQANSPPPPRDYLSPAIRRHRAPPERHSALLSRCKWWMAPEPVLPA